MTAEDPNNRSYQKEIVQILTNIQDEKLMKEFVIDLLTPAELVEIGTRWQIIKLLAKGMPQRAIAKKLGVSIAKITRGSRVLIGEGKGFVKILQR